MKSFLKVSIFIQSVLILFLLYIVLGKIFPRDEALNSTPNWNQELHKNISWLEKDIFDLTVDSKQYNLSRFPQSHLAFLKNQDDNLNLINYYDKGFINSEIYQKLKKFPTIKIYVLLEFSEKINYKTLYKLQILGFTKIFNLKDQQYLGKKNAVFYTSFNKLKNSLKYSKVIDGYILENYTAKGVYKLKIKTDFPKNEITFRISTPFSKKGKKIISIFSQFSKETDAINKIINQNDGIIKTSLLPNQHIAFTSEITYKVSLRETLNNNIHIAGEKIFLKDYQRKMQQNYSQLHEIFTRYSEKIVPSDYIHSIVQKIDREKDLSSIWKQITMSLNKDIRYDWKKRDLFFNGNLTYENIKDMYMTAKELSEKKIGACPERTSLEIALLRELGIAARSSTRLYHIFTEVFIPEKGWITTSTTLNGIPLCQSTNEGLAYFIDWTPEHPIRLKWEGYLLPTITQSFLKDNLSTKKKLATN